MNWIRSKLPSSFDYNKEWKEEEEKKYYDIVDTKKRNNFLFFKREDINTTFGSVFDRIVFKTLTERNLYKTTVQKFELKNIIELYTINGSFFYKSWRRNVVVAIRDAILEYADSSLRIELDRIVSMLAKGMKDNFYDVFFNTDDLFSQPNDIIKIVCNAFFNVMDETYANETILFYDKVNEKLINHFVDWFEEKYKTNQSINEMFEKNWYRVVSWRAKKNGKNASAIRLNDIITKIKNMEIKEVNNIKNVIQRYIRSSYLPDSKDFELNEEFFYDFIKSKRNELSFISFLKRYDIVPDDDEQIKTNHKEMFKNFLKSFQYNEEACKIKGVNYEPTDVHEAYHISQIPDRILQPRDCFLHKLNQLLVSKGYTSDEFTEIFDFYTKCSSETNFENIQSHIRTYLTNTSTQSAEGRKQRKVYTPTSSHHTIKNHNYRIYNLSTDKKKQKTKYYCTYQTSSDGTKHRVFKPIPRSTAKPASRR